MISAGIPLAALSATVYNSGLVLEKRALDQLPPIDVRRALSLARTVLSAPQWLAGFALMLCGLGIQAAVLTIEPVTVVQPVLACGVAVVLVLSRVVLRERLGAGEFGCIAMLVIGLILLGLSAGGSSSAVGHEVSGIWMAATVVLSCALGLLVAVSALRAEADEHQAPALGVSYGIGSGLLYGVAALALKALSGALLDHRGLGGTAIAVATSPYLYLVGGCSLAGLGVFQTALQRCRASIVAPVSNIAGSLYFIVVGTWLFHEHLPAEPAKLAFRFTGILVTGLVLVMLPRLATTAPITPREVAPQRH